MFFGSHMLRIGQSSLIKLLSVLDVGTGSKLGHLSKNVSFYPHKILSLGYTVIRAIFMTRKCQSFMYDSHKMLQNTPPISSDKFTFIIVNISKNVYMYNNVPISIQKYTIMHTLIHSRQNFLKTRPDLGYNQSDFHSAPLLTGVCTPRNALGFRDNMRK